MPDTVVHEIFGELPVVDVWTDCYHTKTGWTGRRKSDGAPIDIVYDPSVQPPVIARMPPGKDWGIARDRDGRILGAIRIERRVVSRKGRRGKVRVACVA
jgi:hypothetical protein